jgi:hypothetical protein
MSAPLLSDIDDFLRETGMSPGYFGWRAASNWRLVERLRDGRRIWPETEAQIRDFMISERSRRTAEVPA